MCPHHNHTRKNLSWAPPHIGVVSLVSFHQCWFAARDVVSCQRCCAEWSDGISPSRSISNLGQHNPTSLPDVEEPPSEEGGTSHHGGSRGGDSREVIGANRSIRHSVSVRGVSASGAASGATGGAGGAASGETARGGAVGSDGSQASSDAQDDYHISGTVIMTLKIIVVAVHVVVCGVRTPPAAVVIVLHSGHIAKSTEEPVLSSTVRK